MYKLSAKTYMILFCTLYSNFKQITVRLGGKKITYFSDQFSSLTLPDSVGTLNRNLFLLKSDNLEGFFQNHDPGLFFNLVILI